MVLGNFMQLREKALYVGPLKNICMRIAGLFCSCFNDLLVVRLV